MKEYRNFSDTIKQQVTMRDVAEHYGFAISTRARKIRCPFHDDKNASLQIYAGNKGWFCFVCNEGGSVIDFVMKYFGLGYVDAIKKLNDDFHLNLDIGKPMDDIARKKAREEYLLRQEAIKRQEEREKLLITAYNAALDRYCFLDMLKTENAPTSPDCPVTMQYAYAVKRLDAAWYEVQKAAENLRLFEKGKEECTKN